MIGKQEHWSGVPRTLRCSEDIAAAEIDLTKAFNRIPIYFMFEFTVYKLFLDMALMVWRWFKSSDFKWHGVCCPTYYCRSFDCSSAVFRAYLGLIYFVTNTKYLCTLRFSIMESVMWMKSPQSLLMRCVYYTNMWLWYHSSSAHQWHTYWINPVCDMTDFKWKNGLSFWLTVEWASVAFPTDKNSNVLTSDHSYKAHSVGTRIAQAQYDSKWRLNNVDVFFNRDSLGIFSVEKRSKVTTDVSISQNSRQIRSKQ